MKCIPKKFLCCMSLELGALVVSIVTLCLLIFSGIVLLVQVAFISKCEACEFLTWRNCYAYSITGFVYTLVMICLNLWFFHGKQKTSVVLTWIVVLAMWLGHVIVLLIVLISLSFAGKGLFILMPIFALIFGIISIAILLYGLMVIVAYWLELKESKRPPQATAA